MNEDVFCLVEHVSEVLAMRGPVRLKLSVRRADVLDRQMETFDTATLNLDAKIWDGEQAEIMHLDQGDDCLRVPCLNDVDVGLKIPRPAPVSTASIQRGCVSLVLNCPQMLLSEYEVRWSLQKWRRP